MSVAKLLLQEFEDEIAATRSVLEIVPEAHLNWSPHQKSMTLGQLALHIAEIPGNLSQLFSELKAEVPEVLLHQPASHKEIMETFNESASTAHKRISSWDEADLQAEWTMMQGDTVLLAAPRINMVRSLLFNHGYHHRGQLTVYLRLLDVPLPGLYGPTADESQTDLTD